MPATEEQPVARDVVLAGRFGDEPDVNLRSKTARGTLVNGAFLVGTNALGLIRGLAIAGFLTTHVYGLWGLLMAGFMTILMLGSVGIDDKYIQQDDPDQERAFHIAFTIQCLLGLLFFVIVLVGMPLFALLYGQPEMIGPGLLLALAIPALVLQMPLWVHYRRMDFVRQRSLQLVDPVVTLVATVALVAAGYGIWGLVVGALIGTWAASIMMIRSCPYSLRLHWDRHAFREYTRFSMPLFVGALSTALLIQVPVTVGSNVLGVAAVGGIALANNIAQFTTRVDSVITQTLYPAICAVKDRPDLLFESFWKSNRLALLWAAPLGAAAALFVGDFVHLVIGERWRFAVPLIAWYGINAAIDQIAFNWTAFFRAVGDTRSIGTASVIALVAMLVIAVPLLAFEGLTAFGIGLGIATVIGVAVRLWYLRRLFPGFAMVGHMASGLGPTLPGLAVVLALRIADGGSRTAGRVLVEALLFTAVVIATTLVSQRTLLRESVGYLRGRRPVVQAPA